MGQKLKSSMGAYVFRSAPNNGHRATTAACPKSASMRHRKWTRPSTKGRLIRLYAKLRAEICVSAWSPHAFGHRPDRRRNVSAIRISPPKERAAHRACVNENAPGAGSKLRAQLSRLNDNLMGPLPGAIYMSAMQAMHKPISITPME